MDRALLVAILVTVAVLVAGVGALFMFLEQRQKRVRRRLGEVTGTQVISEETGEASILRDESLSSIPILDDLLRRFYISKKLGSLLIQADVSMRVGTFVLISLLLGVMGAIVAYAASGWLWMTPVGAVIALVTPFERVIPSITLPVLIATMARRCGLNCPSSPLICMVETRPISASPMGV